MWDDTEFRRLRQRLWWCMVMVTDEVELAALIIGVALIAAAMAGAVLLW